MAGSRGSRSFVVAVTGHTRFAPDQLDGIRAQLTRALTNIQRVANQTIRALAPAPSYFRRKSSRKRCCEARLWLTSCLAAGADQLASRAAAHLGYKLQVVLPGHAELYREMIRFPNDRELERYARDEFDALLKLSHGNVTDLGLPLPPENDAASKETRHKAYDAATRSMLRHCDLLIAIVDLVNRQDLGATGDAIATAIRAGKPIVWIDPTRPDELRWLSHLSEKQFESLRQEPTPRAVTPIIPDVLDEVHREEHPPGNSQRPADWFVLKTLGRKVEWTLQMKRDAFDFRRERLPESRPAFVRFLASLWNNVIDRHLPKPLALHSQSEGHVKGFIGHFRLWAREQLDGFKVLMAVLGNMRKSLDDLIKNARDGKAAPPPREPEIEPDGDADRAIFHVRRAVDEARFRAKELAGFYAGAHRSSFLAMTVLSVLAVAIASVPLPHETGEGAASHLSAWFAGAELLVIFTMIAIYICNRTLKWQEKLINCRLLAERVRNCGPLALAGVDPLDPSTLPIQYNNHQAHKTWVAPYFQKLMNDVDDRLSRRLGNPALPMSLLSDGQSRAEFLAKCCKEIDERWLKGQANYQRNTAARYEQLRSMFEFIQLTMLALTILICFTHFFSHLEMLSFLASVCPAISAAAGSLALQAELVRLRDRSISMARAIDRRRELLKVINGLADQNRFRRFVEETAGEMLSEVSEWRVLFKFRPINSPA
jgi:hypothetical protein